MYKRQDQDRLAELVELIKTEYFSSVNYYRISNTAEVEALYLSAQATELYSARSDIGADLSIDVEIFTMAPYIKADDDFPVEKYSACICAAI